MSKTAQQVIAEEIFNDSDKWDLDDQGMEAASLIIARLERYGYRIIRHRVVSDEEARNIERAGPEEETLP